MGKSGKGHGDTPPQGPGRLFMDRPIVKELINIGTAGEIRLPADVKLPPRARVKYELEADYDSVKHKFLDGGGVAESLILTNDPKTFRILGIEEQPEQLELGEKGEASDARGAVAEG